MAAFFVSLGVSAILLGMVLATDGRVLELRKAKAEVRELNQKIADEKKENARLVAAIQAADKEEFPAEKVAREELNLVHPEDVVLLYPEGSLTKNQPTAVAASRSAAKTPATAPPAETAPPRH
jgi:cell division protein FtsB